MLCQKAQTAKCICSAANAPTGHKALINGAKTISATAPLADATAVLAATFTGKRQPRHRANGVVSDAEVIH
jgi:hypothetical protein